ncbi:MAG: helix-hairpin-helix domain-containing protein [Candidatus Gastranaerophilales bacterium]|nr:helix-hairpin-helix domain-containing protein [Candidatus Gastranaerophilales bacterium]MCM1073617.1 helix-hairpin-helix domain-containing protein [Bacteroides sp.]
MSIDELVLWAKTILMFIGTLILGYILFVVYSAGSDMLGDVVVLFFIMLILSMIFCYQLLLGSGFLYGNERNMYMTIAQLRMYFKRKKVLPLLKNSMVECRLVVSDANNLCIYCKEKTVRGIQGQLIKTKDSLDSNLVSTIWGYIQSTFDSDANAYNIRREFTRYFVHNRKCCYPKLKNEAQNEYCRMVLNPELSNIKCYQIWEQYPKSFYIKGNLKILREILVNLQADKNAFLKYDDLFKIYSNFPNVEVLKSQKIDINNASVEEINSLPGINIVLAKKIIKKREEINGFKSIKDVLLYVKVRPNIYKKLLDKIYIAPMKPSLANIFNIERIIDL